MVGGIGIATLSKQFRHPLRQLQAFYKQHSGRICTNTTVHILVDRAKEGGSRVCHRRFPSAESAGGSRASLAKFRQIPVMLSTLFSPENRPFLWILRVSSCLNW
jgi:hypothetical protein